MRQVGGLLARSTGPRSVSSGSPTPFKANPLPMPFAELYGALESKAVDGQENPYSVILSSKLYEVNKYVSGTNPVYATNPIQVSEKFWGKLSFRNPHATGHRNPGGPDALKHATAA